MGRTRITTSERNRLFGTPCHRGGGSRVHFTREVTPWGIAVTVNSRIFSPFRRASQEAARVSRWTPQRIDSVNCRDIRGRPGRPSLHSYALAWDFFDRHAISSATGRTNAPDDAFLEAFARHGFYLGAWFNDWPHIEWADRVGGGAAPPPTRRRPEPAVYTLPPTLRPGDRGPWVSLLQRLLVGHNADPGRPDGIFGARTEGAVRAVQNAHRNAFDRSIAVDGVVGPQTWGTFLRFTIRPGDRGAMVRFLQGELNTQGFEAGRQDGTFGTRTREAVRGVQIDGCLRVTGAADRETQLALFWGPGRRKAVCGSDPPKRGDRLVGDLPAGGPPPPPETVQVYSGSAQVPMAIARLSSDLARLEATATRHRLAAARRR